MALTPSAPVCPGKEAGPCPLAGTVCPPDRRDKPAVQTPSRGAAPALQRSPTQRPLVTLPSSLCGLSLWVPGSAPLASVAALGRHLSGLLSVGNAVQTCVRPSVSPVLGAVVCPVSSLLLQIQEELLPFQVLLLVTCY